MLQERDLALLARVAFPGKLDSAFIAKRLEGSLSEKDTVKQLQWDCYSPESQRRLLEDGFLTGNGWTVTDKGKVLANKIRTRYQELTKGIPLEQRSKTYEDELLTEKWLQCEIEDKKYCYTDNILFFGKCPKQIRTIAEEATQVQKTILKRFLETKIIESEGIRLKPVCFQMLEAGGQKAVWFRNKKLKIIRAMQARYFDFIMKLAGNNELDFYTSKETQFFQVYFNGKLICVIGHSSVSDDHPIPEKLGE